MKSMKLGTKIAVGFTLLLAMTVILGIVSWIGLSGISTRLALQQQGNLCLEETNNCGSLRRDFAINAFKKDANGKTAKDKWLAAYENLKKSLGDLQKAPGLDQENQDRVGAKPRTTGLPRGARAAPR
jgi:hypothetical protein